MCENQNNENVLDEEKETQSNSTEIMELRQDEYKFSKKDLVKSVIIKILVSCVTYWLLFTCPIFTSLLKIPEPFLISQLFSIILCFVVTYFLLNYKKDIPRVNSIFFPFFFLGNVVVLFWNILVVAEPMTYWLVSLISFTAYYLYILLFVFSKFQLHNFSKTFCLILEILIIYAQTSVISANDDLAFLFTSLFVLLIYHVEIKHQHLSLRAIYFLVSCLVLFASNMICESDIIPFLVSMVFFVYFLVTHHKSTWIYSFICLLSCIASDNDLLVLAAVMFVFGGLVLIKQHKKKQGNAKTHDKKQSNWFLQKGNLYYLLHLVFIGICVLFSVELDGSLRDELWIWNSLAWLALSIGTFVFSYQNLIKTNKVLTFEFNSISLLVIQTLLIYFCSVCYDNAPYSDIICNIYIISAFITVFPSFVYYLKQKTKQFPLLVWQYLKFIIFATSFSYFMGYDEISFFIIPFVGLMALAFSSISFNANKTCKACLILCNIISLLILLGVTEIETNYHIILLGIFIVLMEIGFIILWRYTSKEIQNNQSANMQ